MVENAVEEYMNGFGYRPDDLNEIGNWELVKRDPLNNRLLHRFVDGGLYEGEFSEVVQKVSERSDYNNGRGVFSIEPHYSAIWLLDRDAPDVAQIESESFENAWTEEEILKYKRGRNRNGMVFEYDNEIVGFMLYEWNKKEVDLASLAVRSDFRRKRVGTKILDKLIDKDPTREKGRVELAVRETNLDAQLFFRRNGFRHIETLRGHYIDTDDDAYVMEYNLKDETSDLGLVRFEGKNRISNFV